MEKMMAERFKQEGLSITYDGTVRQTTLSQRLIAQAYAVGGEEMQMKTVEAIYRKYFSEGKDIGDVAVLVPISVENGVFEGEEAAKAWLEGTQGMEEYNSGVLAAQKAGISGVPFFRCAKFSLIRALSFSSLNL
jgi:predicted DsbA family dithiol-disulfide isomerase